MIRLPFNVLEGGGCDGVGAHILRSIVGQWSLFVVNTCWKIICDSGGVTAWRMFLGWVIVVFLRGFLIGT